MHDCIRISLCTCRALNEALEKENRMFEKFQKRLDPKDVQLKCERHDTVDLPQGLSVLIDPPHPIPAAVPPSRSSQLDVQRKKARLKGGPSSER